MTDYIITLDAEESAQVERRAHDLGYQSIAHYLRALAAADALVEELRPDWQDADEEAEVLEADFRQAWHEAMTGKGRPIEELWDALEEEDDAEAAG